MNDLVLRGLAVPFGHSRLHGGDGYLRVAPLALHGWLRDPCCDCDLIWGGHESNDVVATTGDRSLKLFADARGLWFSATIGDVFDNLWRCAAMCQGRKRLDQASADFVDPVEHFDRHLGLSRCTITRANLDHIAIVSDAAFGNLTGVWPNVAPLDDAPVRIRDLAAEFDEAVSVSSIAEFNFSKARGHG